jgi:hypothetical protein
VFSWKRALVQIRRGARRTLGAATYGAAVALTCTASIVTGGAALVVAAATFGLTVIFAAACWIASGE